MPCGCWLISLFVLSRYGGGTGADARGIPFQDSVQPLLSDVRRQSIYLSVSSTIKVAIESLVWVDVMLVHAGTRRFSLISWLAWTRRPSVRPSSELWVWDMPSSSLESARSSSDRARWVMTCEASCSSGLAGSRTLSLVSLYQLACSICFVLDVD